MKYILIAANPLVLDPDVVYLVAGDQHLIRGAVTLRFKARPWTVLTMILCRPGAAVDRRDIMETLWVGSDVEPHYQTRMLIGYMNDVREKLTPVGLRIENVRNNFVMVVDMRN